METQRNIKPLQNISGTNQKAAMAKDFISSNTEKLYRQKYENIITESAVNSYLGIDDDCKIIEESYGFLCDIAKIAGVEITEDSLNKKLYEIKNVTTTPDYKEFICLYNVFTTGVYDDTVNEIRLNGNRKDVAAAVFMYHTFRINTTDEIKCMAYEEYLKTFGESKELAAELFARWEYNTAKGNNDIAEKYYALTKKCCENNPAFLDAEQNELLDMPSVEAQVAAYFNSLKKDISKTLKEDYLLQLTEALEKIKLSDFSEYTRNCISNCIRSTDQKLTVSNARNFLPQNINRFIKSVLSSDGLGRDLMFLCVLSAWHISAGTRNYDCADEYFGILREIAPTVPEGSVNSSFIDFALNGNGKTNARFYALYREYSSDDVDMLAQVLSEINYSSECEYIQKTAYNCVAGCYDRISKSHNNNRVENMRKLRDFTKHKREYADIYRNAVYYIRAEETSSANTAVTPSPAAPVNTAPRVNVQKPQNEKQKPEKKVKTPLNIEEKLGPVYLLPMILGFMLISLGFTAVGDLTNTSFLALWAILAIVYAVVSFSSLHRTYKQKGVTPKKPVTIIETILNIACYIINVSIYGGETLSSTAIIFMAILIANLVIKLKFK